MAVAGVRPEIKVRTTRAGPAMFWPPCGDVCGGSSEYHRPRQTPQAHPAETDHSQWAATHTAMTYNSPRARESLDRKGQYAAPPSHPEPP